MPTPSEHKTVQARILEYAEAIGWAFVPREEEDNGEGAFLPPWVQNPGVGKPPLRCPFSSTAHYAEAERALLGQFRHLHADIHGNPLSPKGYCGTGWEFIDCLRNRGKFFDHEERRERDLILIDYNGLSYDHAKKTFFAGDMKIG